ncbi:MAG: dienelactone hydrolase family protein [Gemmatimonadetes bacterium]|nr:dienelactone hydrolase family protein [Gemmatimonadota bacterium]
MQRWQPSRATAMDEHMAHMSAADMSVGSPTSSGVGGSQGDPHLPASAATAAARIAGSPRHAEWVKIAWEPGSSDSLMAWIVYPMSKAKAPVVVVVHEIFGLSTWVRSVADQFAAEGFIAIAPDLNSRVRGGASTVELSGDSARKLISGVGYAERNKGITAVAAYAMSQPSAERRYGVVGYCWGGSTVFAHAVYNGQGLKAAVAFYGLPYMNGATPIADSLAKIHVPVMLLNGSADARIGAAMPAVDSVMKALGKDYLGKNYDGAIHGFLRAQDDAPAPGQQANPAAQQANLDATKDAWPRTVAFFKKHLGVK